MVIRWRETQDCRRLSRPLEENSPNGYIAADVPRLLTDKARPFRDNLVVSLRLGGWEGVHHP